MTGEMLGANVGELRELGMIMDKAAERIEDSKSR
ncbi:hypothetical protein RSal33209_2468 [Renibacterium salmoninarum ATCC 33209]|uniref:Uncharacterized protein n=1 Tax=Renibacterium salmoninarum (strain ATCC 33209 / DSM 20767 / JCM 11484 / NBRC 15589 / NCIMB 2235) TaxID=288705 RepID=A9WS65_RENSM|nr:hypothetical protein RSal33209_2468 [Renibacterium salmoninarum ATCC 33209]